MKLVFALIAACTCALAQANTIAVKVVDREGKPVQDAVVIAKPANPPSKRPSLPQAVVVQEKMAFQPLVSIAMVGSKIRFINNDPWDHHVRGAAPGVAQLAGDSSSSTKGGFELRLEGKSEGKPAPTADITMTQSGPVGAALLGCFLHNSMRGTVYVTDSPWTAKTDAQGFAFIRDLPNGASEVRIWHGDQPIELPAQSIRLDDSPNAAPLQFQLQVVPRRRRGAAI
jgi:plastocyanin